MILIPIAGLLFCVVQRILVKRRVRGTKKIEAVCIATRIDWGSTVVFFKRSTWQLNDARKSVVEGRAIDTPLRRAGDIGVAYVGNDGSLVLPCEIAYFGILGKMQWLFAIIAIFVVAGGR